MKKIIYIANIRLPTEKAHGIQVMKMCESFSQAGVVVELAVPYRNNHIKDDPFLYYGVKKGFDISWVSCFDMVSYGRIGFWIQTFIFSLSVLWRYYEIKEEKGVVFYSRDEMPAFLLALLGAKVVWETHMGHNNLFIHSLIRRGVPIVAISGGLSDLYRSYGAKKILISPDGVDIEQFQIKETQDEACKKLGLPRDEKLILYTGHLYLWKGVDILVEATVNLESTARVVFVGGMEKDVAVFKSKYGHIKNIMILGNKPHQDIPMYLRAADVLVIPNSAKEKISRLYTSPMKLFEYMASGIPIVASDLPSLREILNEKNSILVEPDNSDDMARGLETVLSDSRIASVLAKQAFSDVIQYSWEKRAKNILNFVCTNES